MDNNNFKSLETVAFTGDYNDLLNKPAIPTVPDSLPADGGNADTVDGKHADEFVLKSGDMVTGSLKVNGIPISDTDVIRKKEMDSCLNKVNELLSEKADKVHTHTTIEIGAETPTGAADKIKVHNADVNAHKAILDKKVDLSGGELKDTVATFNETTTSEFPPVTSGETLERILGDVKKNINSLVARVRELGNPNLLVNGDFQVWQRGTSFTFNNGKVGGTFFADRHSFYHTGTNTNLMWSRSTDVPEGLPFQFSAKLDYKSIAKTDFSYRTIQDITLRAGNTYTFSCYTKGKAGATCRFDIKDRHLMYHTFNGSWQKFSHTFTLTKDMNTPFIDFLRQPSEVGSYFITGMKLEPGSYATPFVPNLYAEEFALCQRYYRLAHTFSNVSYIEADFIISHDFRNMRIIPTIKNLIPAYIHTKGENNSNMGIILANTKAHTEQGCYDAFYYIFSDMAQIPQNNTFGTINRSDIVGNINSFPVTFELDAEIYYPKDWN